MNLINRIQINVSKMLRIIGEKQGNLHLIKRKPIQNIIIPINHIKVGHNTHKTPHEFNLYLWESKEKREKERFC